MNLRRQLTEEPQVNLTSLIDVVLLLLVFFMVSTSFVRQAQLKVRLPEASSEVEPAQMIPLLEIIITADGDFWVNDQQLINNDPKTLRIALAEVAGKDRALPVTIRADARSTHQVVITAMDVVARLGFSQVNIATSNEQEQ
ncbi:MAG: biopolymer transporter ExbD [Gammaproteobacteria bacterium]|nr:biopolymer transporter ExbD [Gammaproteobacteria bacterium]MCZ6716420.1 biopolymer transporter ExbD [Gammaproteobacteria bacterium]MCZ6827640.1 biopolymer transporter ExbD [Gammaproteobacteria bacterium]MCZ6912944.1 biopolymer transporter ExbD [Pseudomonadota bacterium]